MRVALLLVARLIARAVATIVLLVGYGCGLTGRLASSTVLLFVLTFMTWAVFRAALARGSAHAVASPRAWRWVPALAAATALSVPVAFVFGMLDDAQLQVQRGCLRSTAAPLLLPALLLWHEYARRRLTGRSPANEVMPGHDTDDPAMFAVSAGPTR